MTHITINVKVFHGERKKHAIRVSILDKISVVIDKLTELEPSEMQRYYISKLLLPRFKLLNLNDFMDHSFMDLMI